jgi:hypothetical protein
MRLVERSGIDRPASAAWPYVIRPEHFNHDVAWPWVEGGTA